MSLWYTFSASVLIAALPCFHFLAQRINWYYEPGKKILFPCCVIVCGIINGGTIKGKTVNVIKSDEM